MMGRKKQILSLAMHEDNSNIEDLNVSDPDMDDRNIRLLMEMQNEHGKAEADLDLHIHPSDDDLDRDTRHATTGKKAASTKASKGRKKVHTITSNMHVDSDTSSQRSSRSKVNAHTPVSQRITDTVRRSLQLSNTQLNAAGDNRVNLNSFAYFSTELRATLQPDDREAHRQMLMHAQPESNLVHKKAKETKKPKTKKADSNSRNRYNKEVNTGQWVVTEAPPGTMHESNMTKRKLRTRAVTATQTAHNNGSHTQHHTLYK